MSNQEHGEGWPGTTRPIPQDLHRRALRLEWFTTGWNVLEASIAIGAGIASGSIALVAFGVDSLVEVVSAVGVLWRFLRVGPNASRLESEAAEKRALMVVGLTFLLLAAYASIDSVLSLLAQEGPHSSTVGLALSVASLIVMRLLALTKQSTADELGSKALRADAVETWVCAYLSAALLLGLSLHRFLGWWWADAVAAIGMVPFILWQGRDTIRESRELAG